MKRLGILTILLFSIGLMLGCWPGSTEQRTKCTKTCAEYGAAFSSSTATHKKLYCQCKFVFSGIETAYGEN